ncbi:MAG: cellulase family glycosylhydrolase [Paludibacteraceae bacterium]|nr:cellulase family glycosylhydrolase [Paludibacteraceae bacterium]
MKKLLLSAFALACSLQANALDYSSQSSCLNNDYIKEWGRLKLVGNQLCSESGKPVQLRGWSTHGYQWSGKSCYDDEDDFKGMKGFGANVARIAMYITEGGSVNDEWVKNCIDWTAKQGMYCLVDWHILTPGLPSQYSQYNPNGFFDRISSYVKQKGYKHVLYELCNEPNEDTEGNIYRPAVWEDIKDYAEELLPYIEKNDPGAVVIVGTPQWDQAMVFPMEYPLEGDFDLNIMYTFHYYACSHEVYLGGMQAAAGNLPVFVTEWGTTEHKGQQGLCERESDMLMETCNGNNLGGQLISWCNWSFSTEGGESKSLYSANNYNESNLSTSGKYIVKQLRKGDNISAPKASSAYKNTPLAISPAKETILNPENYDEGGEGVAYHDYDAEWVFDQCGGCQAAIGTGKMDKDFRPAECLDVSWIDDDKSACNLGYIVEGEWVKYTIDVKKAGYYKLVPMANSHNSFNVIAISVDGQNAIRDLNDKENTKIAAVRMEVFGTPSNDGGYNTWGETRFTSKYDGKKGKADYGIYFAKEGVQTLSIAFMTECAGFGPLKFIPETPDFTDVAAEVAEAAVAVYPNPSNDGNFTVTADGEANVQVYDIAGKLCYNGNVEGESLVKANLASGIYSVKVSSNDAVKVVKLVVR